MSHSSPGLEGPLVAGVRSARRPLPINLVAAALAAAWLLLLAATLTTEVDDFKQYWQAAVNLRATGDPFMPPSGEAEVYLGYYYPPIFAYLTQWIALFGQAQGQLIWFCLNAAATVAFALLCIRLSGSSLARRYWGPVLLVFLLFPATRINLQLGQIAVFMGLLMVGSAALATRRPAASGLLLALAALTRIFPALLGLPLLLWGRLRAVLWCAAWGLGAVALSAAIYGVEPYLSFIEVARNPPEPYPFQAEHNISFYGMFSRALMPGPYSAAPIADLPWLVLPLTALCSAAALAVCLWRGRAPDQPGLGQVNLGLWLCATMLISTTNGTYTLVLLLVPLLAALRRLELAPDRRATLLLGLCGALVAVPPGWTAALPALYVFAHTGWGLLLLTPALYGLVGCMALLAWLAGRGPDPKAGAAGERQG